MTNYCKQPINRIPGNIWLGWNKIIAELNQRISNKSSNRLVLAIECYQGVHHQELISNFLKLKPNLFIDSKNAFYPESKVLKITKADVTDDAIFGFMSRLNYSDFLDPEKVSEFKNEIAKSTGLIVVYGHAASLIADKNDILVYADMARWEIQLRQRKNLVCNLGINNSKDSASSQYKRSYFVDWRICDRLKIDLFDKADYWLDTNCSNNPKMITTECMLNGLSKIAKQPFRTVPYFDPGPWGGQWMKEKCGLDKNASNYAWSFDGVPEENSLLLGIQDEVFEIPSINLVLYKSTDLLGEPVESRFGKEFPIRFDFLDTMEGGNLSLQVHPTTQYIREKFGMNYTQDESYYLLDAKDDATVYLGVKTGINPVEMISELRKAQAEATVFDAEKYINIFPAKKHDHFLIPNGTIHCSGANAMVLEISATPYIFTFKLYDWARMGLDGKPRAINIEHGSKVIQWNRNTEYCLKNLVDQVQKIAEGDGWIEEKTGLHKNEFIETRRHWFTKSVLHNTNESVNVLNLVEGDEAIIESPSNAFEPFVVHYAETFIIPAAVEIYTIRPFGKGEGKKCATIKAYVRI